MNLSQYDDFYQPENDERLTEAMIGDYLRAATPLQCHLYAGRYNPNDLHQPNAKWLIDNAGVDRATALVLYYQLGAPWYVQYGSVIDIPENQEFNRRTWCWLRLIEQRYMSGFYSDHGIAFDPMGRDWQGCRPDDYPQQPVVKPIPAQMLQPVGGSIIPDWCHADCEEAGIPVALALRINEQLSSLS